MAYKARKRKVKKNIPTGCVHIQATFNNTIVTISDEAGNAVSWASAGAIGYKVNSICSSNGFRISS